MHRYFIKLPTFICGVHICPVVNASSFRRPCTTRIRCHPANAWRPAYIATQDYRIGPYNILVPVTSLTAPVVYKLVSDSDVLLIVGQPFLQPFFQILRNLRVCLELVHIIPAGKVKPLLRREVRESECGVIVLLADPEV